MWFFLMNPNNSAAIQAIGSILSVFIAILTLGVTIFFTKTSVEISKRQKEISEEIISKQERESKELSQKVSALIQYKLIEIEIALLQIINDSHIFQFCELDLGLEVDQETLLKVFEPSNYKKIIYTWAQIIEFRRNFQETKSNIFVGPYFHGLSPEELMMKANSLHGEISSLKQELSKIYVI